MSVLVWRPAVPAWSTARYPFFDGAIAFVDGVGKIKVVLTAIAKTATGYWRITAFFKARKIVGPVALSPPSTIGPTRYPGDTTAGIIRDIGSAMLAVPFKTSRAAKRLVPTSNVDAVIARLLVTTPFNPAPKVFHSHCPFLCKLSGVFPNPHTEIHKIRCSDWPSLFGSAEGRVMGTGYPSRLA